MSKRSSKLLLEDILASINKIERYALNLSLDEFLSDEKTTDAVVRNLEIIGEAASRIPQNFKEAHTEIEWTQIVGLRHRIVHDYFEIDLEIVWAILKNDLPTLKSQVERLLSVTED